MNCNYETNPRKSDCPDPIAAVARVGGCSLVLPFRRGFPWAGGRRGCRDNFTLNLLLIARGEGPSALGFPLVFSSGRSFIVAALSWRFVKNSEHTPKLQIAFLAR